MSLEIFNIVDIIEIMENAVDKMRPPENIREKLDIGYRIENQSVILYEIRPMFGDPEKIIEVDYAKASYIKTSNKWKIYWKRGNLKWYQYEPNPLVLSLRDFLNIVDDDVHYCFKG